MIRSPIEDLHLRVTVKSTAGLGMDPDARAARNKILRACLDVAVDTHIASRKRPIHLLPAGVRPSQ